MSKTVTVDAEALYEVLQAIVGPDHLIRELKAIRILGGSPIDKLIEQFNEQVPAAKSDEDPSQ